MVVRTKYGAHSEVPSFTSVYRAVERDVTPSASKSKPAWNVWAERELISVHTFVSHKTRVTTTTVVSWNYGARIESIMVMTPPTKEGSQKGPN